MKASTKIVILISLQIIIIITSFLTLVYFESQVLYTGNMVNIAGKNRFLASEVLSELHHSQFFNTEKHNAHLGTLVELERNIIFLKDGGKVSAIEIPPLPSKFNDDWNIIWEKFTLYKSEITQINIEGIHTLLELEVYLEDAEFRNEGLIFHSNILANKLGQEVSTLSSQLVTLQITFGIINVASHIFMIYLILIIFHKNAEKEKLATIGQLSSNIAHDVRNPLGAIRNSSKRIETQNKNQNQVINDEVARINRAVKRMSHQVEGVLNYIRIVPLVPTTKSIREMLDYSLDMVEIPKNIKVSLPENDAIIECDSEKLEMVFTNLILNAVQAIDDDDGIISIRLADKQTDLKLEFENSGPLIPDDELSKIFNPLFTTKLKGTGLGLSSCKNIIEQHKGTINVTSNPVICAISLPKMLD